MKWRLGLDIGTNSIGWATFELNSNKEPASLTASGARIFSDGRNPKDKQSLAVMRREPRSARRNRDRYLKRRRQFINRLIKYGLMPEDKAARKKLEKLDPWTLRVRGLDQQITLHELGRALFHLQQRRGFESNRTTDKKPDEKGKISTAAAKVREQMQEYGAHTLGELLAGPRIEDPKQAHTHPVRARLHGTGAKSFYDFYPTRDMIEDEFNHLWRAQKKHHGNVLTDEAYKALHDALFYQRPLKPQPVGKCSLDPSEQRAPRALASVQRLRIYQEINNLKVREPGQAARRLTMEERDRLVSKLLASSKQSFDAMRKTLKLPEVRFNSESGKRKHLDGDKTAAALTGKKVGWKAWRDLPLAEQDAIVERLLDEEDKAKLVDWLKSENGLSKEVATAVANAPLPEGHGNLGRTSSGKILNQLDNANKEFTDPNTGEVYPAPITYDQAAEKAGYNHFDLDSTDGTRGKLPYYGEALERHVAFGTGEPGDLLEKRIGKIANPTVHVLLNQLRRVVNALIDQHGGPDQIVVEMARKLPLSAKRKTDLEREQKANQNLNNERRELLVKYNQPDTYENRLRLRLWEELNPGDLLDRRCPYCGKKIGIKTLFTADIEIDHILPFARTFDNAASNKTVSHRKCNQDKANQWPHKAFSHSPGKYDWDEISARSNNLPENKSWRFGPDAMERYQDKERGFLTRQLNETKYASRLAKTYLQHTGADVWVTSGWLTADLRYAWGLDSTLPGHNLEEGVDIKKNRKDHRHHAIDAIVVGLTDRSLLQKVATTAGRAEKKFSKRLLVDLEPPWENFREDVRASLEKIIVSHKPDHGVQGALHNDTAYGLVSEPDKQGKYDVVHRVPLASLDKPDKLKLIRDPVIRAHLINKTAGLSGKEFTTQLIASGEAMKPPVRRVRIIEKFSVIPINDKTGIPYKAYKGYSNYCYEIFVGAKGKWVGDVISTFSANQKNYNSNSRKTETGRPLLMRLHQNDLLALGETPDISYMRIVKFSKGQIVLVKHCEAGALKNRDADKEDPFKYQSFSPSTLQNLNARLVHVDPTGKITDPGPYK